MAEKKNVKKEAKNGAKSAEETAENLAAVVEKKSKKATKTAAAKEPEIVFEPEKELLSEAKPAKDGEFGRLIIEGMGKPEEKPPTAEKFVTKNAEWLLEEHEVELLYRRTFDVPVGKELKKVVETGAKIAKAERPKKDGISVRGRRRFERKNPKEFRQFKDLAFGMLKAGARGASEAATAAVAQAEVDAAESDKINPFEVLSSGDQRAAAKQAEKYFADLVSLQSRIAELFKGDDNPGLSLRNTWDAAKRIADFLGLKTEKDADAKGAVIYLWLIEEAWRYFVEETFSSDEEGLLSFSEITVDTDSGNDPVKKAILETAKAEAEKSEERFKSVQVEIQRLLMAAESFNPDDIATIVHQLFPEFREQDEKGKKGKKRELRSNNGWTFNLIYAATVALFKNPDTKLEVRIHEQKSRLVKIRTKASKRGYGGRDYRGGGGKRTGRRHGRMINDSNLVYHE